MKSISENIDLKKKTELQMAEPGWFDLICEEVANGESLLEYCRILGIRYALVYRSIMLDPPKKAAYESAMEARKELFIEEVRNQIRVIASGDPNTAVRLKALETIGKHLGMFVEKNIVIENSTHYNLTFTSPADANDPTNRIAELVL